ncbi:MAG: leucine-rich repeat domain-containing protein, partial [Oscillospiraceae bacterium]|nr:leucine-rich repeat domain-containing protein [Oscillospiraceae bacterium]
MKQLRRMAFACAACIAFTGSAAGLPAGVFTPLRAQAWEWVWDDDGKVQYFVLDDSATAYGCAAELEGPVEILSAISDVPVIGIEDSVFAGSSGMTSVKIPESITNIGASAFSGCSGLTEISIPSSITKLGDYVFSGCTGLTSITVPDSVKSIGKEAFSGCTALAEITVPEAFQEQLYDLSPDTAWIKEHPLRISGTKLLECAPCAESVTIPEDIVRISAGAFSGCTGLTSITLPDGLEGIEARTFYGCTGLTEISIPGSVKYISSNAFGQCSKDL